MHLPTPGVLVLQGWVPWAGGGGPTQPGILMLQSLLLLLLPTMDVRCTKTAPPARAAAAIVSAAVAAAAAMVAAAAAVVAAAKAVAASAKAAMAAAVLGPVLMVVMSCGL